jgi:hypothetical protein
VWLCTVTRGTLFVFVPWVIEATLHSSEWGFSSVFNPFDSCQFFLAVVNGTQVGVTRLSVLSSEDMMPCWFTCRWCVCHRLCNHSPCNLNVGFCCSQGGVLAALPWAAEASPHSSVWGRFCLVFFGGVDSPSKVLCFLEPLVFGWLGVC